MISHPPTGLPVAVGTEIRYRSLVEEGRLWLVCVAQLPNGRFVEASDPFGHFVVCTNESMLDGAFTPPMDEVAKVVDSDVGWSTGVSMRCTVAGCEKALNMRSSVDRGGFPQDRECPSHAARTLDACVLCSSPDLAHGLNRSTILSSRTCWNCLFWLERYEQMSGPDRVCTEDYHLYAIGNGVGPSSSRGFGGRTWTVRFTDGREVHTNDLWDCGPIVPEHLRHLFTPNATVEATP